MALWRSPGLACRIFEGFPVRKAWRRFWFVGLAGAAVVASGAAGVAAAELTVPLAELERVLTATLRDPKARFHTVPGTSADAPAGSSLSVGSRLISLGDLGGQKVDIAGAKYGFFVNELNSRSVTITAVPSALRIVVIFESDEPEVVGRCIEGLCVANAALPRLEWAAPSVSVDFTPVWVDGKLSLDAKNVEIGGSFAAECEGGGFFSGSICRLALPRARKIAGTLKSDGAKQIRDKLNGPGVQAQIAEGLKPYLRFGSAIGEVRFSRVAVDNENLSVSFCLACETQ